MKFKKYQEDMSSKEELNYKESNSIFQQDKTEESNKEPFIPKEAIIPEYIDKMIRNQKRLEDPYQIERTIPLLKNALPKLLIPYLSEFSIADTPSCGYMFFRHTNPNSNISVTAELLGGRHFSSQLNHSHKSLNLSSPTEIDILGTEIALQFDKYIMDLLTSVGNENSPISISPNQLSNELENIINEVDSDIHIYFLPDENINITVICNDSDETILQSTKRYHRIKVSGFETKPFKLGRLLNRYIVYVTPAIDKGKLLLFQTCFSLFCRIYNMTLYNEYEYEFILGLRFASHYHPKLIKLK